MFTIARSRLMSRIRGSGNKGTELRLITIFRAYRIAGWRRGSKLPGRPDFVFPALHLAMFVDGCFWHGCPKHATQPKTNAAFWRRKLARNQERDREVGRLLRARGWRVMRIWEHELSRKDERRLIGRLRRVIGPAFAGTTAGSS
jgi:DNA mismatch endonuclease (patch repair protein)